MLQWEHLSEIQKGATQKVFHYSQAAWAKAHPTGLFNLVGFCMHYIERYLFSIVPAGLK